LTLSLGRSAQRQPDFLIVTLADATERKRLEEHLREAEKLEVIGRLAGGVAHDFNNLMTGILLYCDLLSEGLAVAGSSTTGLPHAGLTEIDSASAGAASELRQHVDEVRSAVEQGAAMTQQLLAIGRRQSADPRPVSINGILESTKNLLRRLIGEQIELIAALDAGAEMVLADPAEMRQVVLNLVLNARDAMPLGGKVMLSTRTTEFPAALAGGNEHGVRRAVSFAVTDNGCGMDAETRSHLFEPFFTTKRAGEGTGLGLATVARIVKDAGGAIRVDSHPGRGTRIEVFLPAIDFVVSR
jgi:signal transduction histidine kinase